MSDAKSPELSPFANTIAAIAVESADAPAPAQAGDRYRIVSTIGEGGMGRVLEVEDAQFGRRVAMKELLPEGRGTDIEARFIVESVITANLEHPGIVPVYERGRRDDGSPFYTMRRLQGRSLADAIDEAKSMRERLALLPTIIGVAQTLAFAHEHGVIHRDIKPANIFVGPRGEASVLDWGIAKVRGARETTGSDRKNAPALPPNVKAGRTEAGAVFGTPSYMAPEQARGDIDAIDERTDVFCLGALLYSLVTGRAPYHGASALDVLSRAQNADFPSVDELAPRTPEALRTIVKRAMAKEPSARYLSAVELADELRRASSEALLAPSKSVEASTRAIEITLVVLAAIGPMLAMAAVQFRELGFPIYFVILFAAFGVSLSFIEWRTNGRAAVSHLAVVVAVATFLLALVSATMGEVKALQTAVQSVADEEKWRMIVTNGTRETIGNIAVGAELSVLQLVVWAVARRAVLRRQNETDGARE